MFPMFPMFPISLPTLVQANHGLRNPSDDHTFWNDSNSPSSRNGALNIPLHLAHSPGSCTLQTCLRDDGSGVRLRGFKHNSRFSKYPSKARTNYPNRSWVVIVAGVGFFTDAYSIFSINMVVPMLGIIYYGGTMPHGYETALSVVTLGGSIIGMVGFGLGADIWGRRKMYGLELIITIASTLGVVMSSNGIEGSMSVIVWLLVWRFVLGIGIGAEQVPLSFQRTPIVGCQGFFTWTALINLLKGTC